MKTIISDWTGGLSPQYWKKVNFSTVGAENQYAAGVMNPAIQLGLLSPANGSFTELGNVSALDDATFTRFVLTDDENISAGLPSVYFGNNDNVHAINFSTEAVASTEGFVYTVSPSAAGSGTDHSGHSTFTVKDVAIYQVNGNARLFYFWMDITDGDAGTYDLDSSFTVDTGADSDNLWTRATGGGVFDKDFDLIAEVADNGFMYVANGNQLFKYDGTAEGGTYGTVSTKLTFESGVRIVDMKDARGFLWLAMFRTTRNPALGLSVAERTAYVAVWDRDSTQISLSDAIFLDGVNEIRSLFIWRGLPHVFVITINGTCEIRVYSNGVFKTIIEFDDAAVISTRNAIHITPNHIIWGGADTLLYMYGRITPKSPDALYKIGNMTKPLRSVIAVKTGRLYLASDNATGSKGTINYWLPFLDTGNAEQGNFYTRVIQLPKLSKVQGITFFYPEFTSSAGVNTSIDIYKNMSTTSLKTATLNDVTDGERGWFYIPLGGSSFENVSAIQIKVAYPIGVTVTKSFRFSRIEIEYEPTTKLK